MNLFDVLLYQYIERTAFSFEMHDMYPTTPYLAMKSEDLFTDDNAIQKLIDFAGLPPKKAVRADVPKNRTWMRTLEKRPLGHAWKGYLRHPELMELNRQLDYPLNHGNIEAIVNQYQLPSNLGSWIRNRTKYWELRELIVAQLRNAKILSPAEQRQGEDPNSTMHTFMNWMKKRIPQSK